MRLPKAISDTETILSQILTQLAMTLSTLTYQIVWEVLFQVKQTSPNTSSNNKCKRGENSIASQILCLWISNQAKHLIKRMFSSCSLYNYFSNLLKLKSIQRYNSTLNKKSFKPKPYRNNAVQWTKILVQKGRKCSMNEQEKLQQYLHGAKEVLDDQRLESINAEIPYTWRDVGSERQILIASEQCFCCWTKRIPATRHLTDWNFAQSVQNRQITHRRRRRTLRRRHFHRNEIPQTIKKKKERDKVQLTQRIKTLN